MVDTLLSQWHEYMQSPQYKEECERGRKNRTDENKEKEVNACLKVHSLRHQRRRCKMLWRKMREGTITGVPYSDKDLYARFLDGRLDIEIDKATEFHGYGTLSTGQRIGAFGPRFG